MKMKGFCHQFENIAITSSGHQISSETRSWSAHFPPISTLAVFTGALANSLHLHPGFPALTPVQDTPELVCPRYTWVGMSKIHLSWYVQDTPELVCTRYTGTFYDNRRYTHGGWEPGGAHTHWEPGGNTHTHTLGARRQQTTRRCSSGAVTHWSTTQMRRPTAFSHLMSAILIIQARLRLFFKMYFSIFTFTENESLIPVV